MDWKPQIDAYWARPDRQRALVDATARLVAVLPVRIGTTVPGCGSLRLSSPRVI